MICGLLVATLMEVDKAEGVQRGRLRGAVASLPGGNQSIGMDGDGLRVACEGQPCSAACTVTATKVARSVSSQPRALAGLVTGGTGVSGAGMRGRR